MASSVKDQNPFTRTFYFSYGPDMNPERMNIRQIPFSQRQLGKLVDFEFVFNKTRLNGTAGANIQEKTGSCVYGALYTCTQDELNRLDIFKEVSKGHFSRERIHVYLENNAEVEAQTYVGSVTACNDNLSTVSKDYLDHILCGKDLVPKEYYEFLKSFESWTVVTCPSEEYYLMEAANETEE